MAKAGPARHSGEPSWPGESRPVAELINLNRARKVKARQAASMEAAANRARFGLTKADKFAARREADKAARDLDGKQREP